MCVWLVPRPEWRDKLTGALPVLGVCSIASRLERRLASLGIRTIADLADAHPAPICKSLSVVMRTALELRGVRCIEAEEDLVGEWSVNPHPRFGRVCD